MSKVKTFPPLKTRHLLEDLVLPTLNPSEQACLTYLVRHTVDLTEDAAPTLTLPITATQVGNGSHISQYVFDLGSGVTKATAHTSLEKLVRSEEHTSELQ